ncbi:uncharacterized protein LOC127831212 [Dreissena polymorpha]|uniref:uncharacterized protein LOC127831212 n=1 Tax=Dreissena polymorpha TaxID=45954 RepID=UPI002264EA52|nr:uncharacterized protein LOC127831212 [Dreissena polymorpha]
MDKEETWKTQFEFVAKSSKGEEYMYCRLCNVDVSVASGGRNDVTKHVQRTTHVEKVATVKTATKIDTMIKPVTKIIDPVARAEVLFCAFIAEHNLPFAVADHFTDLVKVMFPDSEVAKKFRCKRTKATNIVTKVLAPEAEKKVTHLCRSQKFSILMDESNDRGDSNYVAILVRTYDKDVLQVNTFFLAMPICNVGNGENLFMCLQEVFTANNIPWENVVGYSSDNAAVMIGNNNSVLSRIRGKVPNVVNIGRPCHIMSTCTQYGVKKLGVPVDELLHDVFTHFQHSSKRRQALQEFREFTYTGTYKLVRFCSTRWLSLQTCVDRFLQQWPAIEAYFASHEDVEKKGNRVARASENLRDPVVALVIRFLSFILQPLNTLNTDFQHASAVVGYLHSEINRLIRSKMAKFVKMSVISAAADVTKVDLETRDNQQDDDTIAIGHATRTYLDEAPPEVQASFFRKVRAFYVELTTKMLTKFPVNDEVLKALRFLRPENRQNTSTESVLEVIAYE